MKKYFFIFVLIYIFCLDFVNGKTIYFVPYANHKHSLFFYNSTAYRDEIAKPFVYLREMLEKNGYTIDFLCKTNKRFIEKELKDLYCIISINEVDNSLLEILKKYPPERSILIALDPPLVVPNIYAAKARNIFGKIFVMFDDLIDNKKYFKFHYPQPKLEMLQEIPKFNDKKLSVLIACNRNYSTDVDFHALYPYRKKIIEFFEKIETNDFDLYGSYWNGYKNYKGKIPHKWEVLKNYRFNWCYENTKDQVGYITEKIFDTFVAGCVPIYWGASNIHEYIPENCFIDRTQFLSEEEVYHFIKNMNEETYNQYITSIRNFLDSEPAKLFSCHNFAERILNELSTIKD